MDEKNNATAATAATNDNDDSVLDEATTTPLPPPSQVREQLLAMGMTPIFDTTTKSGAITPMDTWKAELFYRLDRIRLACGELCQINTVKALQQHLVKVNNGTTLPMLVVPQVNCPAILNLPELDAADVTVPSIPQELEPYFTLHGAYRISKSQRKRKDVYLGTASETKLWKTGNVWKQTDVDQAVQQAANGTLEGSYGVESATVVRDQLKHQLGNDVLKGASVLVIGSSHPWVEAILLHLGVAHVTTLEYGRIESQHAQITTLTPSEFRSQYSQSGTLQPGVFDGVVSHSSVEHSGLGRYGDALNPWGDILTVARAWCVTKEGGFLYLGLPTGRDNILSNWHRTYGRLRWPLVAANWRPAALVDPTKKNSDGATDKVLGRDMWAAQQHGGHGYVFVKETPKASEE